MDNMWLPEPTGKEITGVIFESGLTLEVEESAEEVAKALFQSDADTSYVTLHDPVFGREVYVNPCARIIGIDTRWKDLDMIREELSKRRLATLQSRRNAEKSSLQ